MARLALLATISMTLPVALFSLYLDRVCEPLYGMGFMLLGPFSTACVAGTLGTAMGHRVRRRWVAAALLVTLALASVACALAEFLGTCQVRVYATLFGLYHGAVYDEAVFIEPAYLWLRVWNGAGVAWLLASMRPPGPKQKRLPRLGVRLPTAAAAALFVVLTAASPFLGFVGTSIPLHRALSQELAGEHFTIRFAPRGRGARLAPLMASDLEFRRAQISDWLDLPGTSPRITVYLYEDELQKQRLMGAGRTSIAKPWLHQLHVHAREAGSTLMAHELAHVLLGEISDSWLGLPVDGLGIPRPGIMEGAAVAVERGASRLTKHQWARAMRDIGRQPPMAEILEGLGFWRQSSLLAYTACGSFIRFLVQEYGPTPFAALYAGASFTHAYDRPLPSLLDEWNLFLDTIPVDESDLEMARFVFSRPPVFDKVCPYAGGRCLSRTVAAMRAGNNQLTLPLARRAMQLTEFDLFLGRRFARLLLAANAVEEGGVLLNALAAKAGEKSGGAGLAGLRLGMADGLWLNQQPGEAAGLFRELADGPAGKWLGIGLKLRLILVNLKLDPDVVRMTVGAYAGPDGRELLSSLLERRAGLHPAARIRLGYALSGHPRFHAQAVALLEEDLPYADQQLPELAWEVSMAAARLRALAGQTGPARRLLPGKNSKHNSPAERELLVDLMARIEWLETGGR